MRFLPRAISKSASAAIAALSTGAALTIMAIAAPTAQAAGPKQVVSAWLPWWQITPATQSAVANADLFADTSPFWFQSSDAATIVIKAGASAAGLATAVSTLHARGLKVVPSVTDAMPAATSAAIFADPASLAVHVNALASLVTTYNLDGIDLDYETIAFGSNTTLAPTIRAGFTALLTQLAARLHSQGKLLTVSVVAKGADDASPAHQAYNYAAIGAVVDRVRVMTYDQHTVNTLYPGGPISSVSWVDSVMQYAVSQIPSGKVEMGVPLYGYDWNNKSQPGTSVTYGQAIALMAQYNAPRLWSPQDGEPYFTYTTSDGTVHTVWYNDSQALAARLPLVAKYSLAGIAFWSLGAEDPGIWQTLRSYTYGPNPFGTVDTFAVAPGGAQVRGWAIDANTTDPIRVDLYVDGKGAASTMATTSRPDIGSLYFIYGNSHGYDTVLPLPAGPHQVCAYGINVGPGGNALLGCRSVTVLGGNPIGSYDSISAGLGAAQLSGWAFDPDVADPVRIDVYVDGHGVGSTMATGSRADVGGIYPAWGSSHGFNLTVPVPGGTHQVCAFAINVAAGGNSLLGCRTATVPSGSPVGSVDAVTAGLGTAQINGWALDPDVADPVRVDVYVDGHGVGSATANTPRPDLAGLYPQWGPSHGFSLSFPITGGTHKVCAYAINVGVGGNVAFPCRTIVTPSGPPYGHIDSTTRSADTSIQVAGWAIDPDVADPVRVDFYVDGVGAASMTAGDPRPDIATIFPTYGANHGFTANLPVSPGAHQVCAYAINLGAGAAFTKLGCNSA